MGGRDSKKPKKKSVKVAVTSKFSEKRQQSRHGKQQKKGMAGPSTEFITRTKALKKLQITLKDFRRLCILKGIYPRVPSKTPKNGSGKIFYDIKDLTYLNHEPLLTKFREFKSFMKKIRKSSGRNEIDNARRKDDLKPVMKLDHLVKERYPRFVDALRDMDDCLCMVHLFAVLPSIGRVTAAHTIKCQELSRQWQYYITKSHALNKVFVSIKGYYFQATVLGEQITWLAPHKFTQQVPKEVDLRVMITFLDFYEVFMKFTLYKLYSLQNLVYPPTINKQLDDGGACLLAIQVGEQETEASDSNPALVAASVKSKPTGSNGDSASSSCGNSDNRKGVSVAKLNTDMSAKLATLGAKLQSLPDFDEYELTEAEKAERLPVKELSDAFRGFQDDDIHTEEEERVVFRAGRTEGGEDAKRIFAGMRFFCNREVPLNWLQLCVIAHGGQIGWDGATSPFTVDDKGITHQIVDRPLVMKREDREYIQPQWVFDSINAQMSLPVKRYLAGEKLPPHLSPFVDDSKEGYLPKYREEIRTLQAAAGLTVAPALRVADTERGQVKEELNEDETGHADEVRAEKKGMKGQKQEEDEEEDEVDEEDDSSADEEEGDDFDDAEEDSDSDSDSEGENKGDKVDDSKPRRILELNGANTRGSRGIVYAAKEDLITEEEEHKELAHSVMGKKTKRLYDRMKHGIGVKDSKAAALQAKAEALEAVAGKQKGRKDTKGDTGSTAGASKGPGVKKARKK